jgi:hypothetical protein
VCVCVWKEGWMGGTVREGERERGKSKNWTKENFQ